MKVIAFDVMGNDNGVKDGVLSAIKFVKKNKNYKIILVGDKKEINKYVIEFEQIEIIDVKEEVDGNLGARAARNEKNSMFVAIKLVKENKAHVVFSAGNSGVYISMATLMLGRLPNVKRPAFMPTFPTMIQGKKFVLLDAGANLLVDEEIIVQWAILGSIFSELVLEIKNPRVGLLNVGIEDSKGFEWAINANKKLKNNSKINYQGFIEPRNLLNSIVDVAIVDGYGGNLILKSMEGAVFGLLSLLKKNISLKVRYKIATLFLRGAFKKTKDTFDYRNHAAAIVIGLNYLAFKTHGSADEKSYDSCFETIKNSLDKNVILKLREAVQTGE